jgi:hypothetical protein
MRRGFISWSREEVPVSVLDGRVGRVQAAMRQEGLGAVLVYTSFTQPAAVHWLCNFVPYWSEAMLVVLPEGVPTMLAALTKRVHPWMREVSHVSEVIAAAKLGPSSVAFLEKHVPSDRRIGVVGLDDLPSSVMEPLAKSALGSRIVDASNIFAALRQPADKAELTLAHQAVRLAVDAMKAIPADARQAADVLAAAERSARLAGAEELLQRIAPDLNAGGVLQRMEGDVALGNRYAIELSVAYKGAWVRVGRSIARDAVPASWTEAQAWFRDAAEHIAQGGSPAALKSQPPGRLVRWTLEASIGMLPLAVVAASDGTAAPMPPGSLAVFSVQLDTKDGAWHASVPLVTAATGKNQLLA